MTQENSYLVKNAFWPATEAHGNSNYHLIPPNPAFGKFPAQYPVTIAETAAMLEPVWQLPPTYLRILFGWH